MDNDSTFLDYSSASTLIGRLDQAGLGGADRVDEVAPANDQAMEMSAAMMNQLRMVLATTAFCWNPAGE